LSAGHAFERDHGNLQANGVDLSFLLLQLQHVIAARQSH
jgi:hypothetical protein